MIVSHPGFYKEERSGRVYVAGEQVPFLSWEVTRPVSDEADNLTVELCWGVGGEGVLASNAKSSSALVDGQNVPIKIMIGDVTLIDALVNKSEWRFGMDGETVTVTGKGKIGRLTERKEIRNLKNRTASSVVEEIFAYHNLRGSITGTEKLIGTYSEGGHGTHSATTNNLDDWGLLNWLAECEGFTVRVSGDTAYFGPVGEVPEMLLDPVSLTYGADFAAIDFARDESGTREIIVEGRSWYKKRDHLEYFPHAPKQSEDGVESGDNEALIMRYTFPGHTPEQLKIKVRSVHEELTKRDITGTIYIPHYYGINPDRRIALYGVGVGLSRIYYTTSIRVAESMDGLNTDIAISNKTK